MLDIPGAFQQQTACALFLSTYALSIVSPLPPEALTTSDQAAFTFSNGCGGNVIRYFGI